MKKKTNTAKKTKVKAYDEAIEFAKGAKFSASSYDKTQKIKVIKKKVTVGCEPGIVEITGIATGRKDSSMVGTVRLWLSTFRYKRPDSTVDHVAGWTIPLALRTGQTPIQTAKVFAAYINSCSRPYKAKAGKTKIGAFISLVFKMEKEKKARKEPLKKTTKTKTIKKSIKTKKKVSKKKKTK
jgi:hypothetical protein